jgi:probable F420-dependent oxidoreductase
MTPAFDPGPNHFGRPKVLVGALGPQMTELAVSSADGLLIMPFNAEPHLEQRTWPAIERGLARAGRSRGEVELIGEIIVAVGRDPEEMARAQSVRWLLAFYGSTPAYRPVLESLGYGDLQPRLQQMSREGAWTEMVALIPDELVGAICATGDPAEVASQMLRRFGSCDRICCYFPGYEPGDELLAELVGELRRQSP